MFDSSSKSITAFFKEESILLEKEKENGKRCQDDMSVVEIIKCKVEIHNKFVHSSKYL